MNKPTFAELWAEQQRQIKKGKTAAESLLDIWEWGYEAAKEGDSDNAVWEKPKPADDISHR